MGVTRGQGALGTPDDGDYGSGIGDMRRSSQPRQPKASQQALPVQAGAPSCNFPILRVCTYR